MALTLGVFIGTEAEVEAQLDQVGNVAGLLVRGGGCLGHDEMNDAKEDGFFPLDWGIFNPISFKFPGEAPVQAGESLGVGGLSRVGETTQEVDCCNRPPCLRKKILPNLAQVALGLMGALNLVPVDLEDFDTRDIWILESRID